MMHRTISLDSIVAMDALRWAWFRVRERKGAAGVDGVTVKRFGRVLDTNLVSLADDVLAGTYRPGPVRFVLVQEPGKVRRIAILTMRDRVLQRAVLDALVPVVDPAFHHSSFAYRPGRSIQDAVERIVRLRNRGLTHVVDADIRDCFGSLDHAVLLDAVALQVPGISQEVMDVIRMWIAMPARERASRRDRLRRVGVLQRAPLSPLLCNIYLHQMDMAFARRRISFVRYADDFVALCRSPEHADWSMRAMQKVLNGIKLSLHPGKTSLTDFGRGFRFLGVEFRGDEYTYVTEGARIVVRNLPPDWFHYHADEYV